MASRISLRERRLLARGISPRLARLWGRRSFLGHGNRATLTTNLAGANNDLTFIARNLGTAGNATTVRYVVAGASTPLSISVAGAAITVNVKTNGASAAISTAKEVADAVNRDKNAYALVSAGNAPGNDGTGVVAALAATNLTGGV